MILFIMRVYNLTKSKFITRYSYPAMPLNLAIGLDFCYRTLENSNSSWQVLHMSLFRLSLLFLEWISLVHPIIAQLFHYWQYFHVQLYIEVVTHVFFPWRQNSILRMHLKLAQTVIWNLLVQFLRYWTQESKGVFVSLQHDIRKISTFIITACFIIKSCIMA